MSTLIRAPETRTEKQFLAYVRYFVSDHRPLWAEFEI
jgi:hypothetical protein